MCVKSLFFLHAAGLITEVEGKTDSHYSASYSEVVTPTQQLRQTRPSSLDKSV